MHNDVHLDLILPKTWLGENDLSLNAKKLQSLLIGSRYKTKILERRDSPKLSLVIGDELISSLENINYLELQVDLY